MTRNSDIHVDEYISMFTSSMAMCYQRWMMSEQAYDPVAATPETAFQPAVRARQKWGVAVDAGFQQIPDLLLKHQSKLGLSVTELTVLLNVTMHWWYPEQNPFPRASTIAKRMGVSTRTVERSFATLRKKGFADRKVSDARPGRTELDLSGLVKKLEDLAVSDISYQRRVADRRSLNKIPPAEGPNLRLDSEVPF